MYQETTDCKHGAIPVTLAKRLPGQSINKGIVRRVFLGIMIRNLAPHRAGSHGFCDTTGVLVGE
jgi:S1-C subfamily serine protease